MYKWRRERWDVKNTTFFYISLAFQNFQNFKCSLQIRRTIVISLLFNERTRNQQRLAWFCMENKSFSLKTLRKLSEGCDGIYSSQRLNYVINTLTDGRVIRWNETTIPCFNEISDMRKQIDVRTQCLFV